MVALLKFVRVNPKVIAALFTACKDDDWEIREAAITVLGHRNVADQDTLEALLDAYNDQKWEVRDRALQVLKDLYGVKSNNVTLLINNVNATTQNKDRCIAAIKVLGNLKEANAAVVEALLQACQHENQYVRNAALLALSHCKLTTADALAVLLQACTNENEDICNAALLALRHCNPTSDALKVLLKACTDDNEDIRKAAIEVWRTLQEVSPDILTCLCTIVLRCSKSVQSEQNNRYAAVEHIFYKKESCIAAIKVLVALKANDEDTLSFLRRIAQVSNQDEEVLQAAPDAGDQDALSSHSIAQNSNQDEKVLQAAPDASGQDSLPSIGPEQQQAQGVFQRLSKWVSTFF